jgi:uncharacterized membrane protein YkvA (DUF1232 family)
VRTFLFAIGITIAVWAAVVLILCAFGWRKAREFAALLPNLVRLLRGLARDERVPRGSRLLLFLALVWIASPIDLIPEFIPILGPLDDIVVVTLVLRHLVRRAGPELVAEHWHGDVAGLRGVLRLAGVTQTS